MQQQHRSLLSVGRVYRKINKVVREMNRRRLRRSVALTAPSPYAKQEVPFSPHCLTCHDDLLMAVCSAKSLNLAVEEALPWVFHDDGSLTPEDKQLLVFQFPGCHLIDRAKADEFFTNDKAPHLVSLAQARQKSSKLLKLADVYVFARHDRILYVDSDILFFKRPDALMDVLENGTGNYFTKDINTAYIARPEMLKELTGVRPLDCVNTGILVLNRADIALDKITHMLMKLDITKRSDWVAYDHLIEQTLVAILTNVTASGASHLPREYDLCLERDPRGAVCRHYVGKIRDWFELEGLRALLSERAFLDRWRRFSGN